MSGETVEFTKMHGCGNDYIYVNSMKYPLTNPSELSKSWSAPHYGIGSDGLVLIGKAPVATADFSMRIFNADGTEAMMCGNACRCIGKYVFEKGLTTKTTLQLHTLSGIRELRLDVDEENATVSSVAVSMGVPTVGRVGVPLATAFPSDFMFDTALVGTEVSMGNPHLVVVVQDLSSLDLELVGPVLEHCPFLTFGRSNVEFVQVLNRGHVKMRVWERGSGVTQACGTGACAAVVAAVLLNLTDRHVTVTMDGGVLLIDWVEENDTVFMTGNAVSVFEGVIKLPSLGGC